MMTEGPEFQWQSVQVWAENEDEANARTAQDEGIDWPTRGLA